MRACETRLASGGLHGSPAPSVLRVIDSGHLHPARNMALDSALLEADLGPTLRLYGWSPPGLSIGWFQTAAAFDGVPGEHVLIRRVTGGGAIYHQHELTFAVTGPTTLFPGPVGESYAKIHDCIAVELASIGVPVSRVRDGATDVAARDRRWCFASAGLHDLVTAGGRKVVGSAQRRVRRPRERVLHHGSIVLRPPAVTASCGSVGEWLGAGSALPDLRDRVVAAVSRCLGLEPVPGELDPTERTLADRLVTVQGDPHHLRRR